MKRYRRVAGSHCWPQAPTDQPHDAHQNQFVARVYYPYHPRTGEDIYVVGIRSHRGERCYVIAIDDGRYELIPDWMTSPNSGNMSIATNPCIEIESLQNLRLLINNANLSLAEKVKTKTRRENGETTHASITDHLGAYTIPHINSNGGSKEIDWTSWRFFFGLLDKPSWRQ